MNFLDQLKHRAGIINLYTTIHAVLVLAGSWLWFGTKRVETKK